MALWGVKDPALPPDRTACALGDAHAPHALVRDSDPPRLACMTSQMYILAVMTQVTIRGVSQELHDRLRRLAESRGESLNSTVLHLLEEALGVDGRRKRLQRYVSWTREEVAEFENALGSIRQVDDELWR